MKKNSLGDRMKEYERTSDTKLGDSFRKIIIVKGKMPPRIDEKGYVIVGLIDFLLNPSVILV